MGKPLSNARAVSTSSEPSRRLGRSRFFRWSRDPGGKPGSTFPDRALTLAPARVAKPETDREFHVRPRDSSSDECGAAILRDTAEILRRRLPERLLEHGDESRDGFITEIGRNLLHARAGGQFSNCDDQVQLLTPAPECQPGFPDHETSETALAERDAPRASSSSTRSDSSMINSRSNGEIESVQHRSGRSTAPGSI